MGKASLDGSELAAQPNHHSWITQPMLSASPVVPMGSNQMEPVSL
jgi:hypothetical protein